MRVRAIDRLLLLLVAIALLAVSVASVLLCLGVLDLQALIDFVRLLQSYWVNILLVSLVALAVIILALRLLAVAFSSPKAGEPRSVLVRASEAGSIRITLDTLNQMVQRYVLSTEGVREASSVHVIVKETAVDVKLRLQLTQETIIPDKSVQIQDGLREHLQTMTGLAVDQIDITIDNPEPAAVNLTA
jgi:uncharacterized alkaline shock family protein YloU